MSESSHPDGTDRPAIVQRCALPHELQSTRVSVQRHRPRSQFKAVQLVGAAARAQVKPDPAHKRLPIQGYKVGVSTRIELPRELLFGGFHRVWDGAVQETPDPFSNRSDLSSRDGYSGFVGYVELGSGRTDEVQPENEQRGAFPYICDPLEMFGKTGHDPVGIGVSKHDMRRPGMGNRLVNGDPGFRRCAAEISSQPLLGCPRAQVRQPTSLAAFQNS